MSRADSLTDPTTPRNVQPLNLSGWGDPVFSEEFNGQPIVESPPGADDSFLRFRPDGPVWATQYPDWPRFNAQVPGGRYTNTNQDAYCTLDQIGTGAGNLVLGTVKEEYRGLPYKAGMIQSIGEFTPFTGFFEARCRLVSAPQNVWPAMWLTSSVFDQWPPEVDFFEVIAGNVMQNIYTENSFTTRPYPASFATEWHTYGFAWFEDLLVFYIDGVEMARRTVGIPDTPMYVILNSGCDRGATFSSVDFYIDYFRAWEVGGASVAESGWRDSEGAVLTPFTLRNGTLIDLATPPGQ